jgi:uncharacterized repeat protein (TIGR03803 family)
LIFSWLAVAEAQTNYQRIKSFGPFAQGVNPVSRLTEGSDGLLYGTTRGGGALGQGTVFSLQKDGSGYTMLHSFTNGFFPVGGLAEGTNGALYGTTQNGGSSNYGLAFRLNKNGSGFTVLHEFKSDPTDGGLPFGDLIIGSDGAVYGTTAQGGISNAGTVFKLKEDGSGYTNLHHFAACLCSDGSGPYAGLVQGKDKVLYGTTLTGGGSNFGTIFKLNGDGTGYTVLHSFSGAAVGDGRQSLATLIQAADGLLYGTTYNGGSNDLGMIYKMNTNGGAYSVLLSFTTNGPAGNQPWGGLAEGANGTLFGTTRFGGDADAGTVFRMKTDGSGYTNLHRFATSGGDGYLPQSALLLMASDGALYGVTPSGGDATGGTVFKLFSSPPKVIITSLTRSGAGVLLNLAGGAAGQTYNIQTTTNVSLTPSWQVAGSSVAGIDGRFQFLDTAATNRPMRFYRSATP